VRGAVQPEGAATPAHTVRAWTPALVAAGTLGLGYLDLARGGTTLSAMLLVVGYVVAVPWAILRAGRA
jgi:hypothetical protein